MATQNAQRTKKVEVVEEVKTRLSAATAQIVSEYRGLTVAELAALRHALAGVGGDYKIFKNTLVRRAIDGGEYQPLSEYLTGPSALTFVDGDVSAVAKALRDFSRANPHLVIKGGLADGSLLTSADLAALADLPPRDVLLARLAGALAAPMQQMAGLLQALPRNLAYGMQALIEQREAAGETLPAPAADEAPAAHEAPAADEAPAPASSESGAAATDAPESAEAAAPDTAAPEADAGAETTAEAGAEPAEAGAEPVEAAGETGAEAEAAGSPAEADSEEADSDEANTEEAGE
jgi:large subunit ribosomal protein L10